MPPTPSQEFAGDALGHLAQIHHDMTLYPVFPRYLKSIQALQALLAGVKRSQLTREAALIFDEAQKALDILALDHFQATTRAIAAVALARNVVQNLLPRVR